jgi:hypothetical protein
MTITVWRKKRAMANGLLALALGWLAEVRNFNLFPGDCGGGSVELELRWNGVERAKTYHARMQGTGTWPGTAAASNEYWGLQFVASRLPALATIRGAASHPQKQMLLAINLPQCEFARDDARSLAPEAEAFVERSIADFGRSRVNAGAQNKRSNEQ